MPRGDEGGDTTQLSCESAGQEPAPTQAVHGMETDK